MNYFKFFSVFILLNFIVLSVFSQEDKTIKFDVVDGNPVLEETVDADSAGFNNDEDKYYDDIDKETPMLFLYFDWMPGYGLYENFDVISVHYHHTSSVKADTLILGNYVHPACFPITSNYGRRRRRMHKGVDLGYPTGTPVVAAFDGIVRISKSGAGGYGNLIVIRHDNKLETYYAHLSQRLVNPGQMVVAGDTIGLGGNTGRSYGSHLHFETRYLGNAFNPNKIIDFTSYTLRMDTLYSNGYTVAAKEPVIAAAPTPTPTSNKVYYKVRRGDTLSHIAVRYRTSVSKIKKLNSLRSDFINEGQRLRVR